MFICPLNAKRTCQCFPAGALTGFVSDDLDGELFFSDFCSDAVELFYEIFISSVDDFGGVDGAAALCAQGGDDHSHSRPDVGAGKGHPMQLGRAGNHNPVGVADNGIGSHADQAVGKVNAAFKHLFKEHH